MVWFGSLRFSRETQVHFCDFRLTERRTASEVFREPRCRYPPIATSSSSAFANRRDSLPRCRAFALRAEVLLRVISAARNLMNGTLVVGFRGMAWRGPAQAPANAVPRCGLVCSRGLVENWGLNPAVPRLPSRAARSRCCLRVFVRPLPPGVREAPHSWRLSVPPKSSLCPFFGVPSWRRRWRRGAGEGTSCLGLSSPVQPAPLIASSDSGGA